MHPPLQHGQGGILSLIAPRKTFTRIRRQAKKETRLWEKEEKRRKTEIEDKKKKKATEYFRTLLAHREEFFRFHKNKRIGEAFAFLCCYLYHFSAKLAFFLFYLLSALLLNFFVQFLPCHSTCFCYDSLLSPSL